jgi:DNA-binding NarL/FixJ family response regulator
MSSEARVFVIEADQVIRSALGYILSESYETFTFSAMADALSRPAPFAPDVVLVGISLLADKGAETVATLAGRLNRPGVIVVADSAKAPLALACLRQGAEAIIAKPITHDGVSSAVEALLTRRCAVPRRTASPPLMCT